MPLDMVSWPLSEFPDAYLPEYSVLACLSCSFLYVLRSHWPVWRLIIPPVRDHGKFRLDYSVAYCFPE